MLNRLALAAAACCALTTYAHAGDPKFEYGKADEVAKVKKTEYSASAEAGVVFTTGNSETTTASAGLKASRKTGNNKLGVEGSVTYARAGVRVLNDLNGNGTIDNGNEITTAKQVTAESLAGKIRYDRFLTDFNSLYVAVLANRDLPAGKIDSYGGQVGYSRRLYKTKAAEAVGEAGIDFSHEDLVGGDTNDIVSARVFLGYKSEMTTGVTFETSAEALTNLNSESLPTGKDGGFGQDTRVDFKAAISAKIGKNTAFSTSLEAKYDHRPGPLALKELAMGFVPEASSLDTIMKASLIYSFF
jgi:hypothetical protein